MKQRLILLSLLITVTVGLLVLAPKTAYAHFILRDPSTGLAGELHVAPDDDPTAGQQAQISYDFSDQGIPTDAKITLSVKSNVGGSPSVPFEISGNSIFADYTFPYQGIYTLTLTVAPKDGSATSQLTYDQRVAHGPVHKSSGLKLSSSVLIIAGLGAMVLFIVILNNKDRFFKKRQQKARKKKK